MNTTQATINRAVIDALKNDLHPGHTMLRIVHSEVIAACSGNQKSRRWLQTDGSNWLAAIGEYLDQPNRFHGNGGHFFH